MFRKECYFLYIHVCVCVCITPKEKKSFANLLHLVTMNLNLLAI